MKPMEDQNQTVERVLQNEEENASFEPTNLESLTESELLEESITSADASRFSNESGQGVSTSEGPKLPILEKIDDLSEKIQTLRKEHTTLSNEVKDITRNSFPGSEVLHALQHLSSEHERLKKKHMEESERLKKKYLEEFAERKKLYNEVIELKGNIRVFCRCRPLNQDEIANEATSVVEIVPSQEQELHVICADSSKKHFKFDHVFGPDADQEAVFAQTSPVVKSVLDGYNVCIFAYGQTGTGKTFTMEGTPENRGVNYRTLEELFRIADQRSRTMRYELFVSMLEVYNERIRDLLIENSSEPSKKLEIKQGPEGMQEVPGLVEARVYGTDQVWELLKIGSRVRSVGSTNANEQSSRSHCLLRVTVKGENLVNGERVKSNLWLVDLAGSERVGRIEVEGERLKESQFINKSLSALGDVISALASKTAHVPYRNSKLTHMLQSSLGGDCKTLMFVQISPNAADLGETLCSLNFATRVRGIEHGPVRKQADLSELLKYKHLAEKLKHDEKETKKLQDAVQSLQLRLAAREQICRSLQEKVRELENQLAEERKTRLKQESRAVAAAAAKPAKLAQKTVTERKPPLVPSNGRLPLRRISNFMPPSTPIQTKRPSILPSYHLPSSSDGKENIPSGSNRDSLRGPRRRVSVAVRPPTQQQMVPTFQPKRRVSIATLRPEPSLRMRTPLNSLSKSPHEPTEHQMVPTFQPRRRVSVATLRPEPSLQMRTPLNPQSNRESALQRSSFAREISSRVRRFSKVFSPLPESRAVVEATPTSTRKFMASPPTQQVGSWKPKHPTVIALQKKQLVWSPLKSRALKNFRKSLV